MMHCHLHPQNWYEHHRTSISKNWSDRPFPQKREKKRSAPARRPFSRHPTIRTVQLPLCQSSNSAAHLRPNLRANQHTLGPSGSAWHGSCPPEKMCWFFGIGVVKMWQIQVFPLEVHLKHLISGWNTLKFKYSHPNKTLQATQQNCPTVLQFKPSKRLINK